MRTPTQITAALSALTLLVVGCDAVGPTESVALSPAGLVAANVCQSAGTSGATAVYVNESVDGAAIDLAAAGCDYAIYFDEDAPPNATVRNTTVTMTPGTNVGGAGVVNDGGEVTVTRSTFVTDVTGQYVPVRFENGARGTVADNELSGTHRTGILVRGAGTEVKVQGNEVTGSGAKTGGWAENGLQIDQGAAAAVTNNTFEGHWWDGASNFASTAVLVSDAGSVDLSNNELIDNEFSIYVIGDGVRVSGNRTSSEVVSQSTLAFQAYGLLLAGSDAHVAGNQFTSEDGAVGLYIFAGSEDNHVTGNRFSGFDYPVIDGGDGTMLRGRPLGLD